jgi:hypothetical protein
MSDAIAVTVRSARARASTALFRVMLRQAWRQERAHFTAWIGLALAAFVAAPLRLPFFLLAIGLLYALALGARVGGAIAADAHREFAWTRPWTRQRCFLLHLIAGAPSIVALGAAALLLISPPIERLASLAWIGEGEAHPLSGADRFVAWILLPVILALYIDVVASVADWNGRKPATDLKASLGISCVIRTGIPACSGPMIFGYSLWKGPETWARAIDGPHVVIATLLFLVVYSGLVRICMTLRKLDRQQVGGAS